MVTLMKMSGKIAELCEGRQVVEFYFSTTKNTQFKESGWWIFKKEEQIHTHSSYLCAVFDDGKFCFIGDSESIAATSDTLCIADKNGDLSIITVEAGDPYSLWKRLVNSILSAEQGDEVLWKLKSSRFVKSFL